MSSVFQPVAIVVYPLVRTALTLLERASTRIWRDDRAASGEIDHVVNSLRASARVLYHYSHGKPTPEFSAALAVFRGGDTG